MAHGLVSGRIVQSITGKLFSSFMAMSLVILIMGMISTTFAATPDVPPEFYAKFGSASNNMIAGKDIAFDSNGNIYVASYGAIIKLTSSGDPVTSWNASAPGDENTPNISSITIDAQDNVYVTDGSNFNVKKFNSNGTSLLAKWGSQGSGDGQFDSWQMGIAIDAAGDVYVTGWGNGVQKFDDEGNFISRISGTNTSTAIAFDDSGNMFVADGGDRQVHKFDSNGDLITSWGSQGSGDGQFESIDGIATDSQGNVYVVDSLNYNVQKFSNDGTSLLAKWGSQGSDDGQFQGTLGVEVDNSGYVNVIDTNSLQKFDSDGSFISKMSSYPAPVGTFNFAANTTVSPDGTKLYVTDSGNSRIQIFNTSDNSYAGQIGSAGSGNGEFDLPNSITVSPNGSKLYVSDLGNSRIQIFNTSDNSYAGQISNEEPVIDPYNPEEGQLADPAGLAVSPDNKRLYVSDSEADRINIFDISNGHEFVGSIGGSSGGDDSGGYGSVGSGDGEVYFPTGITISPDGNKLYVSDAGNSRIQIFNTSDNSYAGQFGSQGSGNGELNEAYGVTISPDGNKLYVADSRNSRIQEFRYPNYKISQSATNDNAISVATPTDTELNCLNTMAESDLEVQDAANDYPLGFVEFCFDTEESSNEVTVTFVTDMAPEDVIVQKYNSTTNSFFEIEGAVVAETTFAGKNALDVTYTITDNGELDLDPATGSIKDPIGLTSPGGSSGGGSTGGGSSSSGGGGGSGSTGNPIGSTINKVGAKVNSLLASTGADTTPIIYIGGALTALGLAILIKRWRNSLYKA